MPRCSSGASCFRFTNLCKFAVLLYGINICCAYYQFHFLLAHLGLCPRGVERLANIRVKKRQSCNTQHRLAFRAQSHRPTYLFPPYVNAVSLRNLTCRQSPVGNSVNIHIPHALRVGKRHGKTTGLLFSCYRFTNLLN